VATSDSFTFASSIESGRVEGTSWAPDIDLTKPGNKGTLHWRVAAVDNMSNLSPYVEGSFARPQCVSTKHKPKKTKKNHG
jgi:hypothetical protein